MVSVRLRRELGGFYKGVGHQGFRFSISGIGGLIRILVYWSCRL